VTGPQISLKGWDAFISHASEDKDYLVRPLAEKLTELGVKIWYDEFTLKVGDSLSESIDYGLANSEYGIVVLSKKFFEKGWTKKELNALETRAANLDKKIILPIWHKITKDEMSKYSPKLADIVALNSNKGVNHIAIKLTQKIKGIQVEQIPQKESPIMGQSSSDEYVFLSKWDLTEESEKFYYTEGIDIDSSGYIYVSEEGNYVRKFDPIGSVINKWGGKGEKDGEFETAYAMAIDSFDNILVSDSAGRIQKFDKNGNFIMKWGTRGPGDGQFNSPFGLALDKFGNIFVSEEGNHRIQKFDSKGKFLMKWGTKGEAEGQFNDPIGIATDSEGNVFVADYMNHRIQVFDNAGKFTRKWGSLGKREGQFDHPHGITLDSSNMVYVSDSLNHRIQKFSDTGIFITSWGSEGQENGNLKVPRDLVVDKNGTVYVSDGTNNRVQLFVPKKGFKGLKDLEIQRKEERKEVEEQGQVVFYLNKIASPDPRSAEAAWKGIEVLARHRVIWNNAEIWKAIDKEILQNKPGQLANEALDLLKAILNTANNRLGKQNEVSTKARGLYLSKLTEILESIDATWQHQKMTAKQILDQVTNETIRFNIFWNAWKQCVQIENDEVFAKFTGYFINNLEGAPSQFKTSIQSEIFDLIESKKSFISNRARALQFGMFG